MRIQKPEISINVVTFISIDSDIKENKLLISRL